MKFLFLSLFLTNPSFADRQMLCTPATAVTTLPSKNFDQLEELLPAHRDYVIKNLNNGSMHFGGAFLDDKSAVDGGFLAFSSQNPEKVSELMNADPLVTGDVISFSLRKWVYCRLQ